MTIHLLRGMAFLHLCHLGGEYHGQPYNFENPPTQAMLIAPEDGLLRQYWERFALMREGYLFPGSSPDNVSAAMRLLEKDGLIVPRQSGRRLPYLPTNSGQAVIRILHERFVTKVVTAAGTVERLKLPEWLVMADRYSAVLSPASVKPEGVVLDPYEDSWPVKDAEGVWLPVDTLYNVLKVFTEYLE